MNRDVNGRARSMRWRWLSARLRALRAFSLPVSVLPELVAIAAVRPLDQWHWGILAASVLGVALLHAVGNLLNDYFDFRNGVDRKIDNDEGRPGRVLVRGELKPKDVLAEAGVCLALAVWPGLYLLWHSGPALLWFVLPAALAIYSYTGPPLELKYRALGELFVFLGFGPSLMLAAAYVQTGRLELDVLLISVPVGLVTTAILLGNNIRDMQEDQEAGIRTLVHVVGMPLARLLYAALLVGCIVVLVALAAMRVVPRVVLLAPVLLALLREPLTHVWRDERLPDIDAKTAKFESALLVFVFLAFPANEGLGGLLHG